MAATLEAAKRAGMERVDFTVYTTNLNAIRLYESMGFEREGLARRFTKIDGAWMDAIEMAWFP
jgi:RimJ/RimL family protein N-acetyltransferase